MQDIDFVNNNNTINWALDLAYKFISWAYKHLIMVIRDLYLPISNTPFTIGENITTMVRMQSWFNIATPL